MAIARRASASGAYNSLNTNLAIPSTVQVNDGMVLLVSWNNGSSNLLTTPNGWTAVGSDIVVATRTTRLLKRVATSTDPGSNIALNYSVTAKSVAVLVAYSGVDSTIIDKFSITNDTSSGTSHIAPSLSGLATNAWELCFFTEKSSTNTSWTAPAGMTTIVTQLGSSTGALSALAAGSNAAASDPTGTKTATSGISTQASSIAISLKPSTAASGASNLTFTTSVSSAGHKIGKGTASTGGTVGRTMVPRAGVLFGAAPTAQSVASKNSFETKAQRSIQVFRFYTTTQSAWFTSGSVEKQLSDAGYLLAFSTKLYDSSGAHVTWANIAAGQIDSLLIQRANEIAALNRPIYLSFHHEPEGDDTFGTAADFKLMWQHVHGIFAARCPKVSFMLIYGGFKTHVQWWTDSYPGDAYVDWLGHDPYGLWGTGSFQPDPTTTSSPTPVSQVGSTFLNWVQNTKPNGMSLPMVIGETGCKDDTVGTKKKLWLEQSLAWLKTQPQYKMWLYWNGSSFLIDSTPTALAGFLEVASDPYMTGDLTTKPLTLTLTSGSVSGQSIFPPPAPNTPTILTSPSGSAETTGVVYTFSADAFSTVQYQLLRDDVLVTDWTTTTSPLSLTLPGPGTYQVRLRAQQSGTTSGIATTQTYTVLAPAPPPDGGGGSPTPPPPPPTITLLAPTYRFDPPTVREGPAGGGRLFSRYKLQRGITILKTDGNYVAKRYATEADLAAADVVYRGGHEYLVDNTEANALNDAGYGAFLTEV